MDETEARSTVAETVPRETLERLQIYSELLTTAAHEQNLVATSTLSHIWARHILDSLQLLSPGTAEGSWIDIGSGAGLPGLVVAISRPGETFLVEPRRLRTEFLQSVIDRLDLAGRVRVIASKIESARLDHPAACISARAVAPLDKVFGMAQHLANGATRWILPKGRSAAEEVAAARENWQGEMALIPSVTDPAAQIVVATGVRPRKRR